MALDDPDARDALERRTCLDCQGPTRPGRWRCDVCQASVDERRGNALAILAAARRQASRERHRDDA